MIRKTSQKAYYENISNGLISKRRLQVYKTLYAKGPMTANELFRCMELSNHKQNAANVCTRLGELREQGVVSEIGTKRCNITGKNVILWDVNENVSVKIEKSDFTSAQAAAVTLDFIRYARTRFDIQEYKQIEKLRQLWTYCAKKKEKKK